MGAWVNGLEGGDDVDITDEASDMYAARIAGETT
jgi:hypothetical protein